MRLIDLDQTVIFTITDETQGGMQYEVQMTIAEVFDKFFDGVQPEIIDAIPVGWLLSQVQPYTNDWTDLGRAVSNGAINGLIFKWQKEQEEHGT